MKESKICRELYFFNAQVRPDAKVGRWNSQTIAKLLGVLVGPEGVDHSFKAVHMCRELKNQARKCTHFLPTRLYLRIGGGTGCALICIEKTHSTTVGKLLLKAQAEAALTNELR